MKMLNGVFKRLKRYSARECALIAIAFGVMAYAYIQDAMNSSSLPGRIKPAILAVAFGLLASSYACASIRKQRPTQDGLLEPNDKT